MAQINSRAGSSFIAGAAIRQPAAAAHTPRTQRAHDEVAAPASTRQPLTHTRTKGRQHSNETIAQTVACARGQERHYGGWRHQHERARKETRCAASETRPTHADERECMPRGRLTAPSVRGSPPPALRCERWRPPAAKSRQEEEARQLKGSGAGTQQGVRTSNASCSADLPPAVAALPPAPPALGLGAATTATGVKAVAADVRPPFLAGSIGMRLGAAFLPAA